MCEKIVVRESLFAVGFVNEKLKATSRDIYALDAQSAEFIARCHHAAELILYVEEYVGKFRDVEVEVAFEDFPECPGYEPFAADVIRTKVDDCPF